MTPKICTVLQVSRYVKDFSYLQHSRYTDIQRTPGIQIYKELQVYRWTYRSSRSLLGSGNIVDPEVGVFYARACLNGQGLAFRGRKGRFC